MIDTGDFHHMIDMFDRVGKARVFIILIDIAVEQANLRYASILGYVGAGGLGLILNEKIGWREYASVGMILLALFITVFIIETISRAARKRLV